MSSFDSPALKIFLLRTQNAAIGRTPRSIYLSTFSDTRRESRAPIAEPRNPKKTDEGISALHKEGCAVIEDITHALLSEYQHSEKPDYYAASLRKWFPRPAGGWLGKNTGPLAAKPDQESGTGLELKIKAMEQKGLYITGKNDDKYSFLVDASEFENGLVLLDCRSKMDEMSKKLMSRSDIEYIKYRRKTNARYLYEKLFRIKEITFMNKPEDWEVTCPISVPVLLPHTLRNNLVCALSQEGIYCETPWPEQMGASAGIRSNILTLVCDQRYSDKDMDRMANAIVSLLSEQYTD